MSTVRYIDALDAPDSPVERGQRISYNIDADRKRCKTCDRILPFRMFTSSGHFIKSLGRNSGSADCRDCQKKKRRAEGVPERHQRVNCRGQIWCNNCKRYLPTSEFKRHPSRPHLWWAFCKPCTRVMDRMRYRAKVATKDGREEIRADRRRLKRRKSVEESRERRAFLADAIGLLRRRGLTLRDITELTGTDYGNVYAWEKQERRMPRPSVMAKFEALLMLTMDFPTGSPPFRRMKPHPRFNELESHMADIRAQVVDTHRRHGE